MNCEFCGGEGHEDAPCPVRRESAARYAEEGRRVYPRVSGIEAKVCRGIRGRFRGELADVLCREIAERQQLGILKYGQELAENPAPLQARLRHALEEALDLAVYARWGQNGGADGELSLRLGEFERWATEIAARLVLSMEELEQEEKSA